MLYKGLLASVLSTLLITSLAQTPPPYGSSSPPPTYGSTPPSSPAPLYGSTPPPSPAPSPSPLPSSASPSPQPSPSASPAVVTPTRSFAGSAHFLGPASGCEGTSMDGFGSAALSTTTAAGAFSGTANPAALQVFATLNAGTSSTCVDAFTGLPLPFALFGVLNAAASGASPVMPMTPVTRLLENSPAAMSAADPLTAAYAMVGVAGALPTGSLAALSSASRAVRLIGAAARALYVVQAKGTAAVAAVASGNAQAVAQLVAGSVPPPSILSPTGSHPTNTETNITHPNFPPPPQVSLPAGCRDAALSTSTRTSVSTFALSVLLPPGIESAALNPAAALATALFLYKAGASDTFPSRAIAPSDFALIYSAFKLGLAGAADELPASADFVRQNFGNASAAAAVLGTRAYLLNLRLSAMAGPTSAFLAGLTGGQVDAAAAQMMAAFARDLAAGNFTVTSSASTSADGSTSDDTSTYLANAMMQVYQKHQEQHSSRRQLLQSATLTTDQLTALMASAAQVVAASTALLTQLDKQVASAAAAGSPLDAAVVFRQAAQVASVQQTALTAALVQLAAAAASGNASEVAALSNKMASDFTGTALSAAVQSAAVSQAALTDMLASSGISTQPSAPAASSSGSSSNVAVIVGCTVGIVGGAAVIAGVAAFMMHRRRAAQKISHKTDGGVDVAYAPTGAAAVGVATPMSAAGPATDVEMGAAK
eukprot:XP_001701672.1 predicted protein [Chlamydomonas reinhardtii]